MRVKTAAKEYETVKNKLKKNNFPKALVAFGSARIPYDDPHIQEVIEMGGDCAKHALKNNRKISFVTGGGPSIMTAWLERPHKLGADTGAMALQLPHEARKDQLKFCNLKTSHIFQTFQARKAILIEYAKAIIIFKGGFGTLDELFEVIALIKTKRIKNIPILIYPGKFYKDILNFKTFLEAGTITPEEAKVVTFFDKKEELFKALCNIIDN